MKSGAGGAETRGGYYPPKPRMVGACMGSRASLGITAEREDRGLIAPQIALDNGRLT